MKLIKTLLLTGVIVSSSMSFAQNKDKAKFNEYEPGYYQNFILKDVQAVQAKQVEQKKISALLWISREWNYLIKLLIIKSIHFGISPQLRKAIQELAGAFQPPHFTNQKYIACTRRK